MYPNTERMYDLHIQNHASVLNDVGTMPEWLTGRPATYTQCKYIEAVLYERVSWKHFLTIEKSENLTGVEKLFGKIKGDQGDPGRHGDQCSDQANMCDCCSCAYTPTDRHCEDTWNLPREVTGVCVNRLGCTVGLCSINHQV